MDFEQQPIAEVSGNLKRAITKMRVAAISYGGLPFFLLLLAGLDADSLRFLAEQDFIAQVEADNLANAGARRWPLVLLWGYHLRLRCLLSRGTTLIGKGLLKWLKSFGWPLLLNAAGAIFGLIGSELTHPPSARWALKSAGAILVIFAANGIHRQARQPQQETQHPTPAQQPDQPNGVSGHYELAAERVRDNAIAYGRRPFFRKLLSKLDPILFPDLVSLHFMTANDEASIVAVSLWGRVCRIWKMAAACTPNWLKRVMQHKWQLVLSMASSMYFFAEEIIEQRVLRVFVALSCACMFIIGEYGLAASERTS